MQPLNSLQFLADPRTTQVKHVKTVKNVSSVEFGRLGDRIALNYPVFTYSYQNQKVVGWTERILLDGYLVDETLEWKTDCRSIPAATLTRGPFIFERKMQDGGCILTVQTLKGKKVRQIEKIVLAERHFKVPCDCLSKAAHLATCAYVQNFSKIDICTAKDLTGKLHLLVIEPCGEKEFIVSSFSEQ